MKFYHYVILALIKFMNGQRGREFIIGLLKGSKSKKVNYFLEKNDLWGFYNLFSLSSRSDLVDMFGEFLNEKLIETREERLSDGFIYPLVHITSKGKECLEEYGENFRPKLGELLTVNKRLVKLENELLAIKRDVGELRITLLKKEPIEGKSYTLEKIRQQYPRAYEKWTDDEDTHLQDEYSKGLSVQQLSETFQRQPGAIRSRLRKLGLMEQ